MLHIERLSRAYRVRRLTEEDTAQILALCRSNPLYYRHCGTEPSEADIRQDMTLLPPGAAPEDKYFLGYFRGDRLAAVLDLIDGYPSAETAYIGLFMVDGRFSGQGIGSRLVEELLEELKTAGFSRVRLAYQKANPQSTRFWTKNGFQLVEEKPHPYGTMLAAVRNLSFQRIPVNLLTNSGKGDLINNTKTEKEADRLWRYRLTIRRNINASCAPRRRRPG